jgi:flagellar L-ring protein precursor FlgH
MRTWRGVLAALLLVSGAPAGAWAQSLWRDGASGAALFVDHRARALDDIVTILVVEQASSSRSANTTTSKDTSRTASVNQFPTMFDSAARVLVKPLVKSWLGWKTPSQFAEQDLSLDAQSKSEHTGKGSIDRSDRLTAQMPAKIVKVLPNGNLLIEGRRAVIVNDETQVMTLSGVIRPQDVTSNNTVLSSQIADAEIQMEGRGLLAESQRPGAIFRFLDWLNLF